MAHSLSTNDILVVQAVIYNPPDTQIAVLNRYWICTSPTGVGDVTTQDVCDQMDTNLEALYKALIWNTAEYRGIRVRTVIPTITADAWVFTDANLGVGTAGTVAMPSQTCGLVRFVTNRFGKKWEGRQYLPFPAQDDNRDTGRPTASYQTRAQSLSSFLATPLTVTGSGTKQFVLVPIIVDPRTGTDYEAIRNSLAQTAWATQRRRGAYGRTNLPPI